MCQADQGAPSSHLQRIESRGQVSQGVIRSRLQHLVENHGRKKMQNIQSKYRELPDLYDEEKSKEVITPMNFEEVMKAQEQVWENEAGDTVDTPSTDRSDSQCLIRETVKPRKRFITLSHHDATRWPPVLRRITYDRILQNFWLMSLQKAYLQHSYTVR